MGILCPPSTQRTWPELQDPHSWGTLLLGTGPDWVASARCRRRACLAAIPPVPWRNSPTARPLWATLTPEYLAWRLSGELRGGTGLPAGSRLPEEKEDPLVPALQIDFSVSVFILHPFHLSLWVCLYSIWQPRGSGHPFLATRPPLPAPRLPHVVGTSIVASRQATASGRRTPGCQRHARSRHPHSSSARPLPLASKAGSHLAFAARPPAIRPLTCRGDRKYCPGGAGDGSLGSFSCWKRMVT